MMNYQKRFAEAIELLCKKKPSEKLIKDWVERNSDDLQDWVGENCHVWWCQNIGIIDAAEAMADAPIEGASDKIDYDN